MYCTRPSTVSDLLQYRRPVLLSPKNEPKLFFLVQLRRVSQGHGARNRSRDLTHFYTRLKQFFLFQLLPTPNLDLHPTYSGIWYCQFLNSLWEELVWCSAVLVAGLGFSVFMSSKSVSLIHLLYGFPNCSALLSCLVLPISPCMFFFREKNSFTAGLVEFGDSKIGCVFNRPLSHRFAQDYRIRTVRAAVLSYSSLHPITHTQA